tara:strand:+ start:285 stop:632 length:348 start_codon:yes stop_codon:yes gene_type:complete
VIADLKTPPCNLGVAKFSSISAETALDRPIPELSRNRLGLRLREDPIGGDIRVLRGELVMEINQGIQADSTSQLSTQFEPIPDVGTPDSDPQVDHVYSKDVKAMETTGEAILGVS